MTRLEPRGQELITRYKQTYAIPAEAPVTEAMILNHWELEKRLTLQLKASRPEDRWEVFDRCYSELYGTLDWLNHLTQTDDGAQSVHRNRVWRTLIGEPPQKIYEVGSGKARLITWLATQGFVCRATEVTRERGQAHAVENPNLTWGISDGIHLDQFETPSSYNAVISDNVIEHLHPDDVLEHFKGVWKLLTPGGRYIFCTPHQCAGPADISSVFGCRRPEGMHLREYTFGELAGICCQAGFNKVGAALVLPARMPSIFRRILKPHKGAVYLGYVRILENLILLLPDTEIRRRAARILKLALFPSAIFMAAYKG
jgi:SAM-dependent methyltransferase